MKDRIVDYCLKKKGAIQTYPFGPDPLVIKVAKQDVCPRF